MFTTLRRQLLGLFFNATPRVQPSLSPQTAGGTITGNLNVADRDSDPLEYRILAGPEHGALQVSADGHFVYDAGESLTTTGGSDSFVVMVRERNASDHLHGLQGLFARVVSLVSGGRINPNDGSYTTAQINVTVAAEANTPVLQSPAFQLTADASTGIVTGNIRATATSEPLLYALTTAPSATLGSVDLETTTGVFTYTPTLQARYGSYTGAESTAAFSVTVSNGAGSALVDVVVPILSRNPQLDVVISAADLRQLIAAGSVSVSENANGTVRIIDGTFTNTPVLGVSDAAIVFNQLLGLIDTSVGAIHPGDISVQVVNLSRTDGQALRETYYRTTPAFGGIPVLGSDLILITTGSGQVTGFYSTTDASTRQVSLSPTLTAAAAQAIAETDFAQSNSSATTSNGTASTSSSASLAIDATQPGAAQLVWVVSVSQPADTQPGDGSEVVPAEPVKTISYYIAANGSEVGTVIATSRDSQGFVVTERDSRGVERTISTLDASGSTKYDYWFADSARKIYIHTADEKKKNFGFTGTLEIINKNLVGGTFSSTPSASAVSALANIAATYDFFDTVLGYKIGSLARTAKPYVDAYLTHGWSRGTSSFFLDGHPTIILDNGDEISLETVAHEYTHLISRSIVEDRNLPTLPPTGREAPEKASLDEAYSDIFAMVVNAHSQNQTTITDFLIGDEQTSCAHRDSRYGCTTRKLDDPTALNSPWNNYHTNYSDFESAAPGANYSASAANYNNSTIFSRAVVEMIKSSPTVTTDEWGKVFFASFYKLTPSSTYVDARAAVISSAKALGFTTVEIRQMQNAFDAAGIRASNYQYGATTTINLAAGARDVVLSDDGAIAWVIESGNILQIIDTRAAPLPSASTVYLNGDGWKIALSSSGHAAIVSQPGYNSVSYITYENPQSITTTEIPIGFNSGAVAISDDGLHALISSSTDSKIVAINLQSGAPTTTQADSPNYISQLTASSTGNTFYGVGYNGVTVFDQNGNVTSSVPLYGSRAVATNDSGTIALVYSSGGSLTRIANANGTLTTTAIPGAFSSYSDDGFMAMSADGNRAWVTSHLSPGRVDLIELGGALPKVTSYNLQDDYSHSVATTADGTKAFVVTHGALNVIDTRRGNAKPFQTDITIDNNASDYQQVAVSRDGKVIVATDINGRFTVLYGSAF